MPEASPRAVATALPGSMRPTQVAMNDEYLDSADYAADLSATSAIWSGSAVPGTAGAFVFLTYLVMESRNWRR